MVLALVPSLIGVGITVGLAGLAVRARALTGFGGAVAAAFGAVIVVLAGFAYLALLVLFVVASSLATRVGFHRKELAQLQEGRHGERGVSNVLSHILAPTALVVLAAVSPATVPAPALMWMYTGALAFGTSDTFASELGVLSGQARSIITGRPVPPGTNGGVSVQGEGWAAVGAIATALVAAGLFLALGGPLPTASFVLFAALAGFLGCQIDSILGDTLENRGWLTKGGTNFLGMLSSIAIVALILQAGGAR